MTDSRDPDVILKDYLSRALEIRPVLWLKAKHVAAEVGLTNKQVGTRLSCFERDPSFPLEITRPHYSKSSTWRITRRNNNGNGESHNGNGGPHNGPGKQ